MNKISLMLLLSILSACTPRFNGIYECKMPKASLSTDTSVDLINPSYVLGFNVRCTYDLTTN